uniref:Uncharacterized protein n=1 Tax=Anguilla anguilla TaxID=7936 RepID=A0A0E9T4Q1_ANGAN
MLFLKWLVHIFRNRSAGLLATNYVIKLG